MWPEQFYLFIRCFLSVILQVNKFFYLIFAGFFSISDQIMELCFTGFCPGIFEVDANLWFIAIFQFADC